MFSKLLLLIKLLHLRKLWIVQVFNSCFIDKIKILYTNMSYEKSDSIMQVHKDAKKNLK